MWQARCDILECEVETPNERSLEINVVPICFANGKVKRGATLPSGAKQPESPALGDGAQHPVLGLILSLTQILNARALQQLHLSL